jgi:hypothetical protein
MSRRPRPRNHERRLKMPKAPSSAAVTIEDLVWAAFEYAPGNLMMTVVVEDGSGATLIISLDDLSKVFEAVRQSLWLPRLDPPSLGDVARARSMIAAAISRRESRAAAMLALYLSWHYPDAAVPEQVEATVAEHGGACITLAIDRRLGCAATVVSADYADPFEMLRDYKTATTPAQGRA